MTMRARNPAGGDGLRRPIHSAPLKRKPRPGLEGARDGVFRPSGTAGSGEGGPINTTRPVREGSGRDAPLSGVLLDDEAAN
jgi:hypothetical protein